MRAEAPGPCSRRSAMVFSEIMYHPASRADLAQLEFVEIFNSQPWPENIGGFQLAGAVQYTFPAGTMLPGEAVLVVALDPAAVGSVYRLSQVLGPFTGRLENHGEPLRLLNQSGAVLLEVAYSANPPWPVAADGAGHSLVLARPSWGEGNPQAWAASDLMGGSPGALESFGPEPLREVMINELLVHTTDPDLDFVELYNHRDQVADLSGCHLTDDPATNRFTFAPGVSLGPSGFVALDQTQLGFRLNSAGGTLYLINRDGTRVLDAVRFGAQALGVAFGRAPDGSSGWSELSAPTPGQPNPAALRRDIVINEIMYAPLSGASEDQFVELHNRGTHAVDLSRWRFVAGIDFTMPTNTTLAPGGYLVVARNAAHLLANHSNLGSSNLVGDFKGNLSGHGERLALAMPETVVATNQGRAETNLHYVVVNEVTYQTGGRWGLWAKGGGSSLELTDPRSDNRLADNWADSDETSKAAWTTVEFTGRLDHGDGGTASSLQIFLMGAGECLVDDVEVIGPAGVNLLANPSFTSGLSPWTPQGELDTSFLQETGGVNGSRCLHVRAGGAGDPGANRIRVPLTSSLPLNTNATLRAKVRWLRGDPEILLRLAGNYLEAFGRLAVPPNLGTPGARNSQAVSNAGPAIFDVRHEPVLPAANQPVLVTARLHDPDGLAEALVKYRIDPDTSNVLSVSLLDDGTAGDAVAGDGLFSATLPGQAAGKLIAFHVQASDGAPQPATRTFPSDAPARECLVRFGESQPAGRFGAYHLWVTQAMINRWTGRLKLSNAGLDATFVDGSQRAIYNVGALYAGSAYHASRYTSPTGVACDYKVAIPVDDPLLGSDEAIILWPGLTGGDPVDFSAQEEQTAYWVGAMLGLPFNYQRYVHFYVNGAHRSFIMQDTQKPNADLVRQWFPGEADGELFKVQIWREYDAALNNTTSIPATLGNFTTTGGAKKTARYRWCWTPRASAGTTNDFTPLFGLVDAVNSPSNTYTAAVEAVADIEQWMRTIATEHIVGNWDSYGYGNGQNMYAYKPAGGRWQLLIWDLDVAISEVGDPATADLFKLTNPYFPTFNGDPAVVDRMFRHPKFARAYWRALQDAVNGPLLSSNFNALLDAKEAAFAASGIAVASPALIKTFLAQRRNYLVARLATVAVPFSVSTPAFLTTDDNLVLLSGRAPLEVRDLTINGVPFPVTWTSVTSWTASVVINPGRNQLLVQGLDRLGNALDSARWTNTVDYLGPAVPPEGTVAINEILYRPSVPGAAFVELFNSGKKVAFDLSNWRLSGLDFAFPPGTILTQGQHLVLAQDRGLFTATYGANIPVFAQFQGSLKTNGETLTLLRPGPAPGQESVVDRVKYEAAPPWPASANGQGGSLQLIDPAQDHNRVSNWSDRPSWRFFHYTGTPGANATLLTLFLNSAGELLLDDVWLVAGAEAETGSNLIENGDFERPLSGPWQFLGNHSSSVASSDAAHGGTMSLHLIASAAGSANAAAAQAIAGVTPDGLYTLSFWYLQGTNASGLNFRLTSTFGSVSPLNVRRALFTPGAPNSSAAVLPPYPPVWLNEIQPANRAGLADGAGHREPWVELYHAGSQPLSLDGCYLTDDYDHLTAWPFPSGATLARNDFKVVWADGAAGETSASEWHTRFRLNPIAGSVALVRMADNAPQIVDYLNYNSVAADQSYGNAADGQPATRRLFFTASPGRSNASSSPAVTVFISEWMASNVDPGGYPDPVGGSYDDWFELHNPGLDLADLAGYWLTDNLAVPFQFVIPAGYTVAPGGYLLVWADGKPARNSANHPDLHVSFQLGKSGEAIGLFAPDGTAIDTVVFGPQTDNVSEGRFPDRDSPPQFMIKPTPGALNVLPGVPEAPVFTGVQPLPNGELALAWRTLQGKIYRLEYKNDLNGPQWTPLGDYLAPGASLTIIDSIGVASQRFYRLRQLD